MAFDLDAWCANVAGLRKTAARRWDAAIQSEVSYPPGGLALIAQVEPASYWFNHRNNLIATAVRNFPPVGPIFDIGGGNGYVSAGLEAAGFDCVVLEPGHAGAANAAGRGLAVIRAHFQDLLIPDGSLPAAGLFDVLEHIEDDAAMLAKLHRMLTPGGRLYIAVPSHNLLWSGEDAEAGHFRRYGIDQLRRRLAQAGFAIEYHTYFFAILMAPILLFRALPSRLGLARRSGSETGMRDHGTPDGIIGAIFHRSFRREVATVSKGERLRMGASCLVIARKP